MYHYEYVTRKEAEPYRKEFQDIIHKTQDVLRDRFTFSYQFIGSSSRDMITYDPTTNKGFDFDVNLEVNDDEECFSAEEIKTSIIDAINQVTYRSSFAPCEDSTRVITLKKRNYYPIPKVEYSCDFAIVHNYVDTSYQLHDWMRQQTRVKEETLTDWLLYYVSQRTSRVVYKMFTRQEESKNGADWEWWLITNDYRKNTSSINAYRFRVQAKKLHDHRDNYSGIAYSNSVGLQIELLMDSAEKQNAYPLYMFYSTSEPIVSEQELLNPWLHPSWIRKCANCVNGGFLADAKSIYHLLFDKGRRVITDVEVLNHSLKLSLLDSLLELKNNRCERFLTDLNHRIMRCSEKKGDITDDKIDGREETRGIKYSEHEIPTYLEYLLKYGRNVPSWFEKEFAQSLPDVDGIAFIDVRDRDTWVM